MIVKGFDFSLTGTGIARIDTTTGGMTTLTINPGKLKGHERLELIRMTVAAEAVEADAIAIEGPAWGAKGKAYHQLAGLWHILDHELYRLGVPAPFVVNPMGLKVYICGTTKVTKEQVMMSIGRRFPLFEGDNNAADALGMASLLADMFGQSVVSMPATHRRAADKVEVPEWAASLLSSENLVTIG
jgi:Holliday junction resolvasome RuvABC endonuclease subunit